ncbi:FAD-dependent oxidoreductase [Desulfobacula sp.]|uniref:FAD-dependent oxidoreductase n=1 Tax=Desulfobacula sp. TaxID=2593537 RepID=UPI002628B631|nr:FAD-dependent oxidoreductase [Desulfobacula sp.]
MKKNDLYSKEEKLFQDKNKIYSAQSVKQIVYSTDVRDFGQVAKSIPCQDACPAKTNIPGYIRAVFEKRYGRAYELNRSANILPGVLGRICSRPCESGCRHGEPDNGLSVGICHLKRSCADLKPGSHRIIEGLYAPTEKKVAVIGSGPAGLAAAHDLSILGHKVVIFEGLEKPGGMLMYGIPEFRLPRDLLMLEIKNILRLGIQLKTNKAIGVDISLDQLKNEYDAVVVATGCVSPRKFDVTGEDLENVYNGLDFMKAVNEGQKPFVGDKVIVVGAGFTAVDCARSAIRLGALDVRINIRKTIEYMRIDETEKYEAQFEGIKTYSLIQPSKIIGNNNKVTAVEFQRTRMEKTDTPPYRVSIPIENSQFLVPTDSVIAALGQTPDEAVVSKDLDGLDGVFAAGDFVTGSSDVISAIAGGRKSAQAIDEYLIGEKRKQTVVRLEKHETSDRQRSYDFIGKLEMNTIDMEKRLSRATNEVETGYNDDQAHEEAKRCYLCNLEYEIDPLTCIYCSACIYVAPKDCIKMIESVPVNPDGTYGIYEETDDWNKVISIAIDNAKCIRCGQCLAVCPMDCISVTKKELIEIDT